MSEYGITTWNVFSASDNVLTSAIYNIKVFIQVKLLVLQGQVHVRQFGLTWSARHLNFLLTVYRFLQVLDVFM